MKIWLWFEFLKVEHWIYKELVHTFKNSYLFKNDKQKNMSCIKKIISIYYKKIAKTLL
jgi:hypothetical protein